MHWRASILPFILAASSAAALDAPVRKSLSFGSNHPHAKFTTSPSPGVSSLRQTHDRKAIEALGVEYVKETLGHPEGSFKLRDDSYFDATTRVWHLYFRQAVHDGSIEVADGDINLNIRDGKVLSYGDSFYRGPAPSIMAVATKDSLGSHDQLDHCSKLADAIVADINSDSQIRLSTSPQTASRVMQLYEANCASMHTLDPEHYANIAKVNSVNVGDPVSEAKDAALYFMIASHPSPSIAQSILENFQSHRDQIDSHFIHHLHGAKMPVEVLDNVPGTEGPVKATFAYVQSPCADECAEGQTSTLSLVWKLEVEMHDNWYEAYVDARQPTRIVSVVDWVSDYNPEIESACGGHEFAPIPKDPKTDEHGVPVSTYRVWPWGVNDPQEGKRDIVKSPYDRVASPIGWHSMPSKFSPRDLTSAATKHTFHTEQKDVVCNFTTTWGNNVQAHENWEGRNSWLDNYRPTGNDNMTFVFPYGAGHKHDGEKVEPKSYIDLAVTQLFYTINMAHDLYYRYGFNEVAGNFQNYNFGLGGRENDGVIANAQDGSGYNNANFATPPDGSHGRMRMYIWDTATPFRDGDLEAGIVIHEFSHGLSTRLTGGPANSGCLGWGESGGMGEGWGDFLATVIRSTSNYSDYSMGAWAANREKGIRNYKYSTNMTTNPSTYKTLDGPGYWGVHAIGEVWAQMLFVVLQSMITKHGYSETLFPPIPNDDGTYDFPNDFYLPPITEGGAPIPKHGNTLMVQLVLSGMKLQPCRPSFFAARDAIIQADEILTGGENKCDLWEGFASRGLGPEASLKGGTPWGGGVRKDGFELPAKCGDKGKKPSHD